MGPQNQARLSTVLPFPANKADDTILNELIKASESSFMSIYTRLFNSVLDTGHVLRALSYRFLIITAVEIIQNYRGITILSCMGKLFTDSSYFECTGNMFLEFTAF